MVALGKEKILLLVDNFSVHQIINIELSIVKVKFLPPNTTSKFQPMDVGIIKSFKAHYRKLLVQHKIDCLLKSESTDIDVYQAIQTVVKAWGDGIKSSTILHCWGHTGFILFHT